MSLNIPSLDIVKVIKDASRKLTGAARRAFEANTTLGSWNFKKYQ